MLLHLGSDQCVPLSKVVAVLNVESMSQEMCELVLKAKKEGNTVEVSPPPHKSCVIVENGGKKCFYLSAISSVTLMTRAASGGLEIKMDT